MELNLALDSGGTKVKAILYDENFSPIASSVVGSMRIKSTEPELIKKHIDELISNLNLIGRTIQNVVGRFEDSFIDALRTVSDVKNVIILQEYNIGLSASGIYSDGYFVTSGTGSIVTALHKGKEYFCGGYGAFISDEGSGYWIAREAFRAAIREFEQRGETTLLTEMLAKKLGGSKETFRKDIFSMYLRTDINLVTYIASCASLVTEAASRGDKIALDILSRAGISLAEQIISVSKMYNLPKDLPITYSGSVFKGHEILLSSFSETLKNAGLTGKIYTPIFEPVVGGVLWHYHKTHGKFTQTDEERFLKLYSDFLIA